MPHSQMCVCVCVVVDFFFWSFTYKKDSCPGQKGHLSTPVMTLSESTFHTFSYKKWRNVYMRIKTLACNWLGWPAPSWVILLWWKAGSPSYQGQLFYSFLFFSFLTWVFSVCLSVYNGTCLLSSNPLLGTVDIHSLLTPLGVQRERTLRDS